jgi:hypothetical protein
VILRLAQPFNADFFGHDFFEALYLMPAYGLWQRLAREIKSFTERVALRKEAAPWGEDPMANAARQVILQP